MDSKKVNTLSNRLRFALSMRKMKQSELSQITKIPECSISLYLKKAYEPKPDNLLAIAKALNVSETWLMGYDVPMERQNSPITDDTLSDLESKLIELFRSVPDEDKEDVYKKIEFALSLIK